jgi:uncharacterized repeat protein (TIGR03803 family)
MTARYVPGAAKVPHRSLAAAALLASLGAGPALGGTLAAIHSFTGGADGATPYKGVTIQNSGTLYGITTYGANACPDSYYYPGVGCGVLFKQTAGGVFTPLVTFLGASNGASPNGNLTLSGTTLLGTTYTGGAANQGTVFEVKTTGKGYKQLYSFSGTDGSHPDSYPRLDSSGNLYSTAQYGGPGYTGTDLTGNGVLFKIDSKDHWTAQHDFSGGADGGLPGRIFITSSGTIIGSTNQGGSCTGTGLPAAGCGVVFSFVPETAKFTTLYTFTGGADGYLPLLGDEDSNGDFYGATAYGGAHGYGTLFELVNKSGAYSYKLLYSFTGGADGAYPRGVPAVAKNGQLTGTTFEGPVVGNDLGEGTLFQFAKGALTTLATFTNDAKGGYPEGTPVVESNGTIIGTAVYGGVSPCNTTGGTLISSFGCGTIYSFTP